MGRLETRSSTALPIGEISALATRRREGGLELLAVGDEDFGVVAADLAEDGSVGEVRRHEVGLRLPAELVAGDRGSEYEGVAADGEGNVFLLQEGPARVLALTPDLRGLRATLQLVVEPSEPGFGERWQRDENRRGEALLLLRAGHLLVAKQRDPVVLIEFGPRGDAPHGLGEGFLAADEPFALAGAEGGELAVLASWTLDEESGELLESVNDLSLGPDGRLYLLSSKSERLGRLERPSPGADRARIDADWALPKRLPGGDEAHAEGLALLPGGELVVAVDTKLAGDNLLALERPR